jgi:uracil phosphoribosyltransferase
MIHRIGDKNSILNKFIYEMRDADIQREPMRFRRNMERVGEVLAYELSQKLKYSRETIETPLGEKEMDILHEEPIIASILRAGLPLHQGVLNYFDQAESAFISAYRKHKNNEEYDILIEYLASPNIEKRDLILCDPMLATGRSMVNAYKALLLYGKPRMVHIVSAIASEEALSYVKKNMPANTEIWVAAVDGELTAQSYIVPGLGDAGDLAFGSKI